MIQMSNMHLFYKCREIFGGQHGGDVNALWWSHSCKSSCSFHLDYIWGEICHTKCDMEFSKHSGRWSCDSFQILTTFKKWEHWFRGRKPRCAGLRSPSHLLRRLPSALQPWWPSPARHRRLSDFGRISTCSGMSQKWGWGWGGCQKGCELAEKRVGSIAWHFIKRGKGKICPLTVPIWERAHTAGICSPA